MNSLNKTFIGLKNSFQLQVRFYALRNKNILRNRHNHRNNDGAYKIYNESIKIVPEEFKQQDEYAKEKEIQKIYEERYRQHLKAKEKLYSVQEPKKRPETNQRMNQESVIADFDDTNTCEAQDTDMPISLKNDPFKKSMHQCIFCKHNIPMDYKNVRLLSQFVSPQTGIIYSQQATGLCTYKYTQLEKTITKSRKLGIMPFFYKETVFVKDPELFDPFKNNLKAISDNYDKRKLNSDDDN